MNDSWDSPCSKSKSVYSNMCSYSEPAKHRIHLLNTSRVNQYKHNPFAQSTTTFISEANYASHEFFNYKLLIDSSMDEMRYSQTTLGDKGGYAGHDRQQEESKVHDDSNIVYSSLYISKGSKLCRDSQNSSCKEDINTELILQSLCVPNIIKEINIIKSLAPVLPKEINLRKVVLPPSKFKNTLLLDLDETLMHTFTNEISHHYYNGLYVYSFKCLDQNGEYIKLQIVKRPQINEFLELLSKIFELIVCCLIRHSLLAKNGTPMQYYSALILESIFRTAFLGTTA